MRPPFSKVMEQNQQQPKDVFSITNYGRTYEVKLDWEAYRNNGTLALQLNNKPAEEDMQYYAEEISQTNNPYVEPYGVVTVNLPESEHLPNDTQFVDVNNLPGVEKWLVENNIAKPAGIIARSGYCAYPAFKFNAPKEALQKVVERKQEIARAREPLFSRPNSPKMK